MKIKKILSLMTAMALLLGNVSAYAATPTLVDINTPEGLEEYLREYIKNNYKDPVTEAQLNAAQLKGMFDSLDPYSNYYTKEEYAELMDSLTGSFVGIGAYLEVYNGYVKITKPIPGSPAEKVGLAAGDIIMKVDGVSIENMALDTVVAKIKGVEGTKVKLTVLKNSTKKQEDFIITRGVIVIEIVSSKMLNKEQGYIALDAFDENAASKVIDAVESLVDKGAKGIVLDLRNNPGGYLSEAITLSDYFLAKGKEIVSIDYKNATDESIKDVTEAKAKGSNLPLVILVNANSASASEIVASALQMNGRAKIVGVTSYGKGTVQTLKELPQGDGIKLTIAEYKGPNNTKINGIGVKPDYVVALPDVSKKTEIEKLAPFTETKVSAAGETGLNVFAAQQRLNVFGNKLELTGKMDTATVNALKVYQKDNKLSITSKLDASTKKSLEEKTKQLYNQITFDSQLGKALEVLKKL